ncbi:MAG TPA: hypothetical protein VGK63_04445 [Candidatus Limnocylindrales bacterium]
MHLQVRTTVKSGSGGSLGAAVSYESEPIVGDPVEARPGALHGVLQLLREGEFNLRVASGRAIETTGEFIFAVGPEDDDEEHERQTQAAAALLRDNGYPSRIVRTHHLDVSDQVGALDDAIAGLPQNELVNELFVGTPNADGTIPLQVTTIRVSAGT